MIKVTYKNRICCPELYYANDFHFKKGVPFSQDGLYIQKDNEIVAFINSSEVKKVEKLKAPTLWRTQNDN